jgi:hypothetical protein
VHTLSIYAVECSEIVFLNGELAVGGAVRAMIVLLHRLISFTIPEEKVDRDRLRASVTGAGVE